MNKMPAKKRLSEVMTSKSVMVLVLVVLLGYFYGVKDIENHAQGGQSKPDPALKTAKYDKAPPFTVKLVGGEKVSLSDYAGRWVLINFWATWCGPCVLEMPSLSSLAKKMQGKGFEVLAIHSGPTTELKIKEFAQKHNLDMTMAIDEDKSASASYGITSIPSTFIVNKKGDVVAAGSGMREWDSDEMIDYFNNLMEVFDRPAEAKKETGS